MRALFILFLCFFAIGCGNRGDGKLRVGLIDTGRILEEMPRYRDLRNDLAKDRSSFFAHMPANPTQEEMMRLQSEAEKKQKDWQKRVMETLQQAVKEIEGLTAEVAKQKDLDMVVISTPYSKTVYYHAGQDITIDVLLKLQK